MLIIKNLDYYNNVLKQIEQNDTLLYELLRLLNYLSNYACNEDTDSCDNPTISIDPTSENILPDQEIQFSANENVECNTPCYTWEISLQGSTGSTIDRNNGLYTAGTTPGRR